MVVGYHHKMIILGCFGGTTISGNPQHVDSFPPKRKSSPGPYTWPANPGVQHLRGVHRVGCLRWAKKTPSYICTDMIITPFFVGVKKKQ